MPWDRLFLALVLLWGPLVVAVALLWTAGSGLVDAWGRRRRRRTNRLDYPALSIADEAQRWLSEHG